MVTKKKKTRKRLKEEAKNRLIPTPSIIQKEWQEISFNFNYIDLNQSTCHIELEGDKKLSKYWNILKAYSWKTRQEAESENGSKFTVYWDFPSKNQTGYTYPKHISKDVDWARIHAWWMECLVWYILYDVFYIVFLDPEHKFFYSKKKHT